MTETGAIARVRDRYCLLKVYSNHAAIFNYIDLQKCYFPDQLHFKLLWFQQHAVAEALKQQMKTYISNKFFTSQIFDTGFMAYRPKTGCHGNNNGYFKNRLTEPTILTNLLISLRSLALESLSKKMSLHPMFNAYSQLLPTF